jgi:hypothetical protein
MGKKKNDFIKVDIDLEILSTVTLPATLVIEGVKAFEITTKR